VTWTAYYATTTADTFGSLASPTVTQIATGTFTVSSTRTQYTTNISIPSAATTGIQILFTVGAQTSGTWIIDTVQLEKGSTATSFDYRPYGTELALCQRYYEVIGGLSGAGYNAASAAVSQIINFNVSKRTAPTMTTLTLPNYGTNSSGFVATSPTTNGFSFYIIATALGAISYGSITQAVVSATSEL
jgi:hypothetical protein